MRKKLKIKLSNFDSIDLNKVTHTTRQNKSFILGPSVKKFEETFAEYTGSDACAATGNCTDSLRMCLQAYGIGPGSRVAVPSFTWLSTAEVVKQLYAHPVFVYVDDTLCMDTNELQRVIDSVDAVIYVNLFGNVADIDNIINIAGSTPLIEDNAQATGAIYNHLPLGARRIPSCYSFYPTKNLATLGDAGCVTGPKDFVDKIKYLRNHGQGDVKFQANAIGWNSRMDSIHADILLHELTKLDKRNARRREIALRYRECIRADFQDINPNCVPVYHQFCLFADDPQGIATHLKEHGIQTRSYYNTPIHKLAQYSTGQTLPQTELYSKHNICIPVHPFLTDEQVDFIIERVNECE